MKREKLNQGITLIALVITIIVLLILAGVTIATLTGDNGLLTKSSSVQFKSDVKQYEEELRLSIHNEEIEALGNRTNVINVPKKDTTTGEESENYATGMVRYIPSFNISKYGNKLEIRNDELVYIDETNSQEREWFGEVKLILAKIFIKVNYVDRNGNKLAEPETISTTTGRYETEPKVIEGYEAERPLYEGKTSQDTEISITYLQESGNLAYIGLDESGNETDDESKIVAYTVSGIGNFTGEDLVIPRKYNDLPVTKVKDDAFKSTGTIKNVIISNTMEYIGRNSFGYSSSIEQVSLNCKNTRESFCACGNINKVVIGKNTTELGADAFNGCSNLVDLTIYSEKLSLGAYPFDWCSKLENVKVNMNNNSYKTIDGIVFSKDETKLVLYPVGKKGNYEIPSNLRVIGAYAFITNKNITNIYIPDTVESIEKNAFWFCDGIEEINVNAKSVAGAFVRCSNLEKIIVGKNVTNLGGDAFNGAQKLTDVTLYSENLKWGAYPFINCSNLENIKVNEDNKKYKTIDGVVFSKDGEALIIYPPGKKGNYTIPDGVKTISGRAFLTSNNLTELDIPNSVNKIEEAIFVWSSNSKTLNYAGTIEQWNEISKHVNWKLRNYYNKNYMFRWRS